MSKNEGRTMRLKSKIDGKIYLAHTFDTYTDDFGLEYVAEDGSESNLSAIATNGGRTGYSSIAQMLQYWEDAEKEG